jgi:hypothetical protein
MEFVSNEHKMIRGFPHSRSVANVWPTAGEETQWVMVIHMLKGCAGRSWFANICPLYGRASANRSKFHIKLTNLGTLCGCSEEEVFANPTILVESANGFGFGQREGFAPPCARPCGPCTHQAQRRGLKLGTGLSVS